MRLTCGISIGLFVALALVIVVPARADTSKDFARGHALITAKALKSLLDKQDPKLIVIGVVKSISYTLGHIPGSYNVWRADYTDESKSVFPYSGMALNRAQFQDFARRLGIDNDSKVVVYDEKYDATRLWWMFYLYGKTDVRVLDGGYLGWKAAGYDTALGRGVVDKKRGNFVAKPALSGWIASMADVSLAETDPTVQVWDTRESEEWEGSRQEPGAYVKGRIGWAKFLGWQSFRNATNNKPAEFKTPAEIRAVLKKMGVSPDKDHIFYCQSGVRSTTPIFALYLTGYPIERIRNYDGSWIEWSYYSKANGVGSNSIYVGR